MAHFSIEHDGVTEELDGISCMVGNTAVIQNGINLFPDCRMNDGLLDIAIIEPVGLVQLLPTALAAVIDPAGKGLGRPQFTMFQAREGARAVHPVARHAVRRRARGQPRGHLWRARAAALLDLIVDDLSPLAHEA